MRRIEDSNLWVGTARDARDFRVLFDRGIRVVVDLALEETPASLPREIAYCRLPLMDGAGNPDWLLRTAIALTAGLIQARTTTLVACGMGMSRSPCIGAAALARACGGSPNEYLAALTASGPADIAPGLWSEILEVFDAMRQLQPERGNPVLLTP
jgi:protein-tyrosine phosphatase